MNMVNSYRFLARSGIAFLVLAAVTVLGVYVTTIHTPHPAGVAAASARPQAWNHWKAVQVVRSSQFTGAPVRVLVIGASVSHGLGASTPAHDYVSDLTRMIESRTHRPVQLTVWSRPGARISISADWALPRNQQIVITLLITNDFLSGTPLLSYQASVTTLLGRVRQTSPHASLLCVGAWESATAVDRVGLPVAAYDALDQRACLARGGHYLSPSPIYQDAAWRGPVGRHTAFGRGDDFHPNNMGHQHLADAIFAQLERDHALPATQSPSASPRSTTLSGRRAGSRQEASHRPLPTPPARR